MCTARSIGLINHIRGWFEHEIRDEERLEITQYYREKNLDVIKRELEREAGLENAPKVKANSKISKAEKEARKKQKMMAFQHKQRQITWWMGFLSLLNLQSYTQDSYV